MSPHDYYNLTIFVTVVFVYINIIRVYNSPNTKNFLDKKYIGTIATAVVSLVTYHFCYTIGMLGLDSELPYLTYLLSIVFMWIVYTYDLQNPSEDTVGLFFRSLFVVPIMYWPVKPVKIALFLFTFGLSVLIKMFLFINFLMEDLF